jgi:hypothetical protein
MPLTGKGKKIKAAMAKEYGKKAGERVFYATENKGSIKGVTAQRSEQNSRNTKAKGKKKK